MKFIQNPIFQIDVNIFSDNNVFFFSFLSKIEFSVASAGNLIVKIYKQEIKLMKDWKQ